MSHDAPRVSARYIYGPTTVELRFRPSPQSTTIQPECFNRFKTALACRGGSRITRILLELLQYYYDSRRCLYVAATSHTDAPRFDKSGWIIALEGPKSLLCDWGLKKRKLYVRQMRFAQKSMNNVELYLLCVLNLYIWKNFVSTSVNGKPWPETSKIRINILSNWEITQTL